ncbi:MAG TPA: prepilin peptidase [Candidatus Sulfotelmatobacter sp.]|jgi:leader peptidase (prepilin peptidase)/N-methyltransferase|nr:prepilin peptidase [Candidatus Sulfotelmatobacter sp.]
MRHAPPSPALSLFSSYVTVETVIPLFFFLFGIVIGSFLNVCISRIPEGLSIVSPGSRCPRCLNPIKPYDNIPVFGWLLLRGKCRNCALPISPMYPLVEFATGLIFVLTYYEYGLSLLTLKWLTFSCLILVLVVTDLRVRLLPDLVNFPGMAMGLVFAFRIPIPDSTAGMLFFLTGFRSFPFQSDLFFNVLNAVLGALLGSMLLWGAAALYKLARKRDGMGMGDVKMMAMVGAFLGPRGAFLTILLGTLLGTVIGLLWIAILYLLGWKRGLATRAARRGFGSVSSIRWAIASQYQLPLGTFLGVGALAVVYSLPWLFSIVNQHP